MLDRLHDDDGLDVVALRYACDELGAAEAAAFESLLGEDQQARDALVAAMERVSRGEARPDPGYRAGARRRLSAAWAARRWVARGSRWALLGTVAASLLFIVGHFPWSPAPGARLESDEADAGSPHAASRGVQMKEAIHYADLSRPLEQINRIRSETARRKLRPEEPKPGPMMDMVPGMGMMP